VDGLVKELSPRVSLVTNGGLPRTGASLVSQTNLFEGQIAYLRIGRVDEGLAPALREACQSLGPADKLKGAVLDLRFTDGQDYAAAADTADLFVKKEQPLLNWGKGVVQSKEKNAALASPIAVLVNRQTSEAAEALAAVLRETGVGLLLGSTTAGQALVGQEFPLSSGARLRIATDPVQLGDGTALPGTGLKPDIAVEVSARDEQAYYGNAFRQLTNSQAAGYAALTPTNRGAATNRPTRRTVFNEAELVRERRESLSPFETAVPEKREAEPEKPMIHDPAVARALDLLKGLAIVHQSHS